jgi:hypothetical protein
VVDHPSAALLVRVWLEGAEEFRARLLTLGDVTEETPGEEVTVAVVSSPEDVIDAVRTWLDGIARRASDPPDGDG